MTGRRGIAAEARHLTQADVGTQSWVPALVKAVESASDDDLGTMVVARAVLTKASDDRAAEITRRSAAAKEQELRAAAAAAARRRHERQERNRRRRSRLREQVVPRSVISLLYSLAAGYFAGITVTDPLAPGLSMVWSFAQPILVACLITVAMSLVVDWFLDDPGGQLRAFSATVGFFIGAAGWVDLLSGFPRAPYAGQLSTMAWCFGIAWMIGAVLEYGLGRATARRPENNASRRISSAGWTWIPTVLGALAGLTALFFGSCSDTCSALAINASLAAQPAWFLQFDVLGIGSSVTAVGLVAVIAYGLRLSAGRLAQVAPALGAGAAVVGPALGLLAFLAYPLNVVTVAVGAIMGQIASA